MLTDQISAGKHRQLYTQANMRQKRKQEVEQAGPTSHAVLRIVATAHHDMQT